jgi:tetratricopeptide (TPR) repeat protein
MSGILLAVSRVALGLSLTVSSAGVQNPSTPSAGNTQQTPAQPLRVTAQQTPEQRALQDATRIQDPVEKLAALRKVRSELTGPVAAYLGRQVDEAILWHLVEHFRDRRDEIAEAFDRVRDYLPQGSTEVRLGQLVSTVSRLLDNKIYLDAAEQAVRVELTALEQPSSDQSTESVRIVVPDATSRVNALRGRALEALGRLHLGRGDDEQAVRELKEAVELNPALARAPIALAEIEIKRGNKAEALEYYMVEAVSGRIKPDDERAFRALYAEVRGSNAELEATLDRVYDKRFPNPITSQPYDAGQTSTNRVVLLELFTGSACTPCVSADLSWDAVLTRYPDTVIAPLAYHAHIPGPDPMVVPGGDARRLFYQVRGVPTLHIDGAPGKVGGGSREMATRTYGEYIAAIDKALAQTPTAAIRIDAERSGSRISVTATASRLPADASNLRFHIVLAERHLVYLGENGIRHHAMVVRAVAGEKGSGITIRGSSDTTVDYTFDLSEIRVDLDRSVTDEIARRRKTASSPGATPVDYRAEAHAMTEIDPANLVVVAFVQGPSKTVLQAARVNVK